MTRYYSYLMKPAYYFNLARNGWQEALESIDEPILDEAIEECLKQREMPPTLSQFMDYCKQLSSKHTEFYIPAVVEKAKPTVAEENLRQMKLMLNMRVQ